MVGLHWTHHATNNMDPLDMHDGNRSVMQLNFIKWHDGASLLKSFKYNL